MEKSVSTETTVEKREKMPWVNRIISIAAYPIAGISGIWVAANELHNAAYQKAKGLDGNPHFGEIQKLYDGKYVDIAKKFEDGLLNTQQRLTAEWAVKKEYSKAVGGKMKALGFGDGWGRMEDLPNKWHSVNRGTKQSAIISGLTVAGVAIGALLTIANSKSLIEYFSQDSQAKER